MHKQSMTISIILNSKLKDQFKSHYFVPKIILKGLRLKYTQHIYIYIYIF